MTEDRVQNFRKTMQEIVGVQNGIIPEDSRDMNAPEDKQSWNDDYSPEHLASAGDFRNQLLKNLRTSPQKQAFASFDKPCI